MKLDPLYHFLAPYQKGHMALDPLKVASFLHWWLKLKLTLAWSEIMKGIRTYAVIC